MCIKMSFLRCSQTNQVTYWCIEVQLHVRCKILLYNNLSCIISQYENRSYINKQMRNLFWTPEHLVKGIWTVLICRHRVVH